MTKQEKKYLKLVNDFEAVAKSYMQNTCFPRWKKNADMYNLLHANKNLENDPRYKHRSHLYIPKIRAAIKRILAALIGTYFASPDVVGLKSRKKNDPVMAQAAELLFADANYRLTETVKWFLTLLFACLDSLKYGNAAMTVGWEYQEKVHITEEVQEIIDDDGNITYETIEIPVTEVLIDKPLIRNVPTWNLLISPTADPLDPVNTTPVLIERQPMFLHDVLKKMESREWIKPAGLRLKGEDFIDGWEEYQWEASSFEEGLDNEEDIDKKSFQVNAWRQVEVWHCFVKYGTNDVYFLSLKGKHVLTEIEEVEDKFPCRGRPYVLGGMEPDSEKVFWQAFTEITEGLQTEMNAIRNQRRDNVNIVLNRRPLVRSTAGIDIRSLMYSAPGRPIVGLDITEQSIRWDTPPDVTSSSYKEEEMTERSFEELTGITPYSMGTQRPGMQQTATGTSILTEEANTIINTSIKIINDTLVIPTLTMFIQFLQKFEDEEVLRWIAEENNINFDEVWTNEAIENKYSIEVNAGVGATSREIKFRNLGMLLDRMMATNSQYGAPVMDIVAAFKEALPLAGWTNPDKFINEQVLQTVMAKYGQTLESSLQNPQSPPLSMMGQGNSGGSQIESMQGFGGDNQIYR